MCRSPTVVEGGGGGGGGARRSGRGRGGPAGESFHGARGRSATGTGGAAGAVAHRGRRRGHVHRPGHGRRAPAPTWVAKVPSVPSDPSRGVLAALERLAADLGRTADDVLADCALFVHGSTVATNTMLEGKGAQVGLLTTAGFRDALEIRRGLREDQWDHRRPYAPGAGAPLPAPGASAGASTPTAASSSRSAPTTSTRPLATFAERGRRGRRHRLVQQLRRRPPRGGAPRRPCATAGPAVWVTCSAARLPDHGRVRAHVDGGGQRRPRAPHRRLPGRPRRGAAPPRACARPILLVQSNGGAASVDQLSARPVNLLLSRAGGRGRRPRALPTGRRRRRRRPADRATSSPWRWAAPAATCC